MNYSLRSVLIIFLLQWIYYPAFSQTIDDTAKADVHHTLIKTVVFTQQVSDNTLEEMEKFNAYVKKHIRAIPGVHGSVTVGFTIEKDGSLTHVRMIKGLNKAADQEALRLVKAYPRWEPMLREGKPISTETTLPVVFD